MHGSQLNKLFNDLYTKINYLVVDTITSLYLVIAYLSDITTNIITKGFHMFDAYNLSDIIVSESKSMF